jgi:hypothetical protein
MPFDMVRDLFDCVERCGRDAVYYTLGKSLGGIKITGCSHYRNRPVTGQFAVPHFANFAYRAIGAKDYSIRVEADSTFTL